MDRSLNVIETTDFEAEPNETETQWLKGDHSIM
jgi:hypothetical protein